MIKTFTENDLLRFLYNDVTISEKEELKQALLIDIDLNSQYLDLQTTKDGLDKVCLSPSESTINEILSFSKRYHKESV